MKRKKNKKSKLVRGSQPLGVWRTLRRPGRPKRIPKGARSVIMGLDGEPFTGDCSCPICAEMAAEGIPQYTMVDGELVEVAPPPPPEMIEISMRGTPSTYPYLPLEPEVCSIPVGCSVNDFLESLSYFSGDRAFMVAFPWGTLRARVNGEDCDRSQVLRPGDVVEVHGERDPEQSRFMDAILHDPERDER